jgi:peptide/nickel transport system substrate-binding protein
MIHISGGEMDGCSRPAAGIRGAGRVDNGFGPGRTHVRTRVGLLATVATLAVALVACGGGNATPSNTSGAVSATPKHGGSLTVLEETGLTGAWPTGLDPATDATGSTNQSYLDAVYGELFELGPNGTTVPDLAAGYDLLDGARTVAIHLRAGVTFSDGTPFNADAVVFNFKRDLASAVGSKPQWPVTSVTSSDPMTVDINLSRPYAPLINSIHDANVNWIVSPTALRKMGEDAFKLNPVGAGPFVVVSDTVSSSFVLQRNPHYWQAGLPYLDNLTFKSVASDEAALETMQAGQGQAYEGLQTPQLVSAFQRSFHVTDEPSTSPYVIQLNTAIAPFDSVAARQAVYYATDTATIDTKLFGNQHPITQGFTAPGGLFFNPRTPGYRTFDLAKAKQLVQQAGGITVDLMATQSSVTQTVLEALQTMWQAAGMRVTIHVNQLASVIQQFDSKKWQASLQTAGAFDPAAGLGVNFRFGSVSQFSGVHDPRLDEIFGQATGTNDTTQRKALYDKAAQYISDHAYAPFLFPVNGWNIAANDVVGPGLTTLLPASAVRPEVIWEKVGVTG